MKNKETLSAPSGINDWWNDGIDATIHPNLREQIGMVNRPFTAQEEESAMKDLLENGFQ